MNKLNLLLRPNNKSIQIVVDCSEGEEEEEDGEHYPQMLKQPRWTKLVKNILQGENKERERERMTCVHLLD